MKCIRILNGLFSTTFLSIAECSAINSSGNCQNPSKEKTPTELLPIVTDGQFKQREIQQNVSGEDKQGAIDSVRGICIDKEINTAHAIGIFKYK